MEAHPIPQNVTSFQFRLVGDMTLKQFVYLASGLGVAYLTFTLLAANYPIVAWPAIVLSSLSGIAFAFLPLGERSLDHWLGAYLKAVYSPTQRVWIKNNQKFSENPLFKTRLNVFLSSSFKDSLPLQKISPQTFAPPAPPLPSSEELSETVRLASEAHNLQQQVLQTEKDLAKIKEATQTPGAQTEVYSERLDGLLNNLQRLIRETTETQTRLARQEAPETAKTKVKVEIVTPPPKQKLQLMLTSLPNVINGITLDQTGNYLSDVVVVIRDKDGLPVRALKTNKLGQFTGATPLPNGTYTVELEKETQVFDIFKIELTGSVLPPLTVAAKKIAGSS